MVSVITDETNQQNLDLHRLILSNHGISRIFMTFFLPDFSNKPKKMNYLFLLIFFDL